jgi:hypothetical protein
MSEVMTTEVAKVETSRTRRVGYYVMVVAALALVVFGLGELLFLGIVGWLGESALEEATEPGAGVHLFHVLGHALFAWLLLVCLAVQLRHPERRFASVVFALAAMVAYSLGSLVSGVFDPLEVVAIVLLAVLVWLNPGREEAKTLPFHRRALVASVPILVGALVITVGELNRQVSGISSDPHVEFGHHGLMAAMALILVFAVLIGSSSLTGRRLVAVLAAGSLVYLGVASMLFPDQVSSLGTVGGVSAVVVGLIYGRGALSQQRAETTVTR